MHKRDEAPRVRDPLMVVRTLFCNRRFLILLLLTPFLFEGALICFGNWASVLGKSATVRTPVLDGTWELGRRASAEVSAFFQSVPWGREVVIGVGFASFALGALLLRVRRER
jgi:hypothetical protein